MTTFPGIHTGASPARDSNGRPYFPSLTGLRALAAFTVLFSHVERYRQITGRSSVMPYAYSSFIGGLAVSFFFVLSGFLITSLLLTEKAGSGTIRINQFLRRRVLRIWPLYYTVLAAGYLISLFVLKDTSPNPLKNGLVLNILLLPNIAFAFYQIPDILIQIWSIGTEDQFYLVWPFLIRHSTAKKLFWLLMGIILGSFLLRLAIHLTIPDQDWLNVILYRTRIDCMALGGLFAMLIFYRESRKWVACLHRRLMHPLAGWLGIAGFLCLLYLSWRYTASFYQAYNLLFGLLIIRVTGKPLAFLEWGPLKYLGKISYGIYLLHNFLIYFCYRGLPAFPKAFDSSAWADLVGFLLAGLLTVSLAAISYEWLESRFLRRPNKQSTYA